MRKENKMGTMPVGKLLFSIALPMIISMLVQACYNIVDSYFVAQLSEDALTAVSLAFPVQNLMIAITSGTGVGINALLSRSLGEKNFKTANKAATNGLFLALLSYGLFLLFGLFGARIFFEAQTDDPEIIEYGVEYLSIICTVGFGMIGQMTLERLLQSTGRSIYSMITQTTGAVINIIMDPIMIFGLLGMPKMGVAGAAVATVLGQCVAMVMAFIFNVKKNPDIRLNLRTFRPEGSIIKKIYAVGLPSIAMLSIGSIMTFGMNSILLGFSTTAAAVFGVYFKLQSFVFMPVIGLNNAVVPIVSYNYGARNRSRITKTLKLGMLSAFGIMCIGVAAMQLFPRELLSIFNASQNMLDIGEFALRIISLHFPIAAFSIIMVSSFQALGNGVLSLIASAARQLLVLLPAAFLLAKFFGLNAVWWSFVVAEVVCLVLSALLLRRLYKKKILPMDTPVSAGA
ncbi:MAG: MATE family efflux transporter [Christensenellaceae bacterium]|nr:MATE family efflux transporter [Christensenellaceae bacterium]